MPTRIYELLRELALGKITGAEKAAAREELSRLALLVQDLAIPPDKRRRRHIRVAWALDANLYYASGVIRCVTNDISAGGFSVLLTEVPPTDACVEFAINIPGAESVRGSAQFASLIAREEGHRVSFKFVALAGDGRDRLERCVLNAAIAQLLPRTPYGK